VQSDEPYIRVTEILDEIPLYLIPKVIREQIWKEGGATFEIRVNRTHYYHFTITMIRLVKWHREDVMRGQFLLVTPECMVPPEQEKMPWSQKTPGDPVSPSVPEITAVLNTGETPVSSETRSAPALAAQEGAHG
jgi:hypothetical protein